ncbi:MAG: phage tail protein [Aggregatilineales bacterium]
MSQPYVGEIRLFAGNFAPAGWMFCDGQVLPIAQNDTLFNLIGTTYGGDGQSTFALPDLRGRLPLHMGSGFTLAENGGAETVTVTVQQLPAHSHIVTAAGSGTPTTSPAGAVLADGLGLIYERATGNEATMGTALGLAGGSQPHENRQPYLGINFIISLFGVYPSPN